jgi:hypothetical protein
MRPDRLEQHDRDVLCHMFSANLLLGFVAGEMTDQLDCIRGGLARALTSTGNPATMK